MEIRQFLTMRRIPLFVLFTMVGAFLVVQESEIPFWMILFAVAFAILERQFNNIFNRSPNEFEALSMFSISWRQVVFVKNLATVALTIVVALVIAPALMYFSPHPFHVGAIADACLYATTMICPLLDFGNAQSVEAPRRRPGSLLDDPTQAAGMLLFVLLLSLPYAVLSEVLHAPMLNLVYGAFTGWYWFARSIPKTVHAVQHNKAFLCAAP